MEKRRVKSFGLGSVNPIPDSIFDRSPVAGLVGNGRSTHLDDSCRNTLIMVDDPVATPSITSCPRARR
jgi:hypothetical protein